MPAGKRETRMMADKEVISRRKYKLQCQVYP